IYFTVSNKIDKKGKKMTGEKRHQNPFKTLYDFNHCKGIEHVIHADFLHTAKHRKDKNTVDGNKHSIMGGKEGDHDDTVQLAVINRHGHHFQQIDNSNNDVFHPK